MITRYMTLLYYSLINLGLGEILPRNEYEYLFCICSMIISALVFTNVFSSISSMTQMLNQESMKQQEITDGINTIMNTIGLKECKKAHIRTYKKKTAPIRQLQQNFDLLLSDLPQSLQTKIICSSFSATLLTN